MGRAVALRRTGSTHGVHVIEQAVEVCAAAAGEPLSPILPSLPVNREAELWADEVVREAAHRPVVLLSPGAGGAQNDGLQSATER